MAAIRLDNLTKDFGGLVAVDELSLTMPDGEFIALLGPSGCGKTTTMNMIAGLEQPTSGRDLLRRPADEPRADPGRRNVGFVFQNYAIFTHMDVYDEPRLRAAGAEAGARARAEIDERWARRRDRRLTRHARPQGRPAVRERHAEGRARPLDDRRAGDLPARRAVLEPRRRLPRVHARRAEAHPATRSARRWSTSRTTRSRR